LFIVITIEKGVVNWVEWFKTCAVAYRNDYSPKEGKEGRE
jgi:hypothetical protein